MFLAIRRWWFGGRGKITLRLFLFEFAVVVAGVLVAQAVADWARERGQLAEMELAKSRMEGEIAEGSATARAWLTAIPCLDSQLGRIMVAAGDATTIDSSLFERPGFRTGDVTAMSSESGLRLIERYGAERAQLYFDLQYRAGRHVELAEGIAERWMNLSVIDPANGQVRDGDRVNARAAASAIRSALRSMRISQEGHIDEARQLGVAPLETQGRRLPRDCQDIAQSGSIMPYR